MMAVYVESDYLKHEYLTNHVHVIKDKDKLRVIILYRHFPWKSFLPSILSHDRATVIDLWWH